MGSIDTILFNRQDEGRNWGTTAPEGTPDGGCASSGGAQVTGASGDEDHTSRNPAPFPFGFVSKISDSSTVTSPVCFG